MNDWRVGYLIYRQTGRVRMRTYTLVDEGHRLGIDLTVGHLSDSQTGIALL